MLILLKGLDQGYKFKLLNYKLTIFQIIRHNLRNEIYFIIFFFLKFFNKSLNFQNSIAHLFGKYDL